MRFKLQGLKFNPNNKALGHSQQKVEFNRSLTLCIYVNKEKIKSTHHSSVPQRTTFKRSAGFVRSARVGWSVRSQHLVTFLQEPRGGRYHFTQLSSCDHIVNNTNVNQTTISRDSCLFFFSFFFLPFCSSSIKTNDKKI